MFGSRVSPGASEVKQYTLTPEERRALEVRLKGEERLKLTREEYLEARATGVSRLAICRAHDLTEAGLSSARRRWGICNEALEVVAVKEWRAARGAAPAVSEQRVADSVAPPPPMPGAEDDHPTIVTRLCEPTHQVATTQETPPRGALSVQLSLQLGRTCAAPSDVPTQVWRGTREQVLRFGLAWVQLALADAAQELQELLGVDDVSAQVQQYVDRVLA